MAVQEATVSLGTHNKAGARPMLYPGSKEHNRNLYMCAKDVQLQLSNISYIMTRRSKKDYREAFSR
jgi:DNA polymerase/3'-5' exonuclease PolX